MKNSNSPLHYCSITMRLKLSIWIYDGLVVPFATLSLCVKKGDAFLWCSCRVNFGKPTERFATVRLPFRLEKKKIVDRRNDVMAIRVRSLSCAVLLDGILSCTTVPPMRMAISALWLWCLNHCKYKRAKIDLLLLFFFYHQSYKL